MFCKGAPPASAGVTKTPLVNELRIWLREQRAKLFKNSDQGYQLQHQPLGCIHPLPR
jgi:hypothetical protein